MKKSLIALAALATVGAAQAQSSVTMYGLIDLSIASGASDAAGNRFTSLNDGAAATSRLGFRGTEDLGGGNRIGFNLEGCLNPSGLGTMGVANNNSSNVAGSPRIFNREANVEITTKFGSLRLGTTDITDQINIDIKASLNGNAGLDSIGTNIAQDRAQVVRYTSPRLNGFQLQVGAAGGQTSVLVDQTGANAAAATSVPATVAKATQSVYAEYAQGPLLVMAGQTVAGANKAAANTVDIKETSYGVRYQVTPTTAVSAWQLKVNGLMATANNGSSGLPAYSYVVEGNNGSADNAKMTRLFAQTALPFLGKGVSGTIMYGSDKVETQTALDATHWNYSVTKAFSKRTSGYVSHRDINYKSTTTDRTLTAVGVVHSF